MTDKDSTTTPDGSTTLYLQCSACEGEGVYRFGETLEFSNPCSHCEGEGYIALEDTADEVIDKMVLLITLQWRVAELEKALKQIAFSGGPIFTQEVTQGVIDRLRKIARAALEANHD
jgi:hypothetical protein